MYILYSEFVGTLKNTSNNTILFDKKDLKEDFQHLINRTLDSCYSHSLEYDKSKFEDNLDNWLDNHLILTFLMNKEIIRIFNIIKCGENNLHDIQNKKWFEHDIFKIKQECMILNRDKNIDDICI